MSINGVKFLLIVVQIAKLLGLSTRQVHSYLFQNKRLNKFYLPTQLQTNPLSLSSKAIEMAMRLNLLDANYTQDQLETAFLLVIVKAGIQQGDLQWTSKYLFILRS